MKKTVILDASGRPLYRKLPKNINVPLNKITLFEKKTNEEEIQSIKNDLYLLERKINPRDCYGW